MNSIQPSVTLRPMTGEAGDLESALELSRAVGWAYRLDDWRVAQSLGQGILAEENGQVIASAICWPYGDAFATCGSIIVAPPMQGRGLGRSLLAHLLQSTGSRAVMLNSTAAGMRLYGSFGFEATGTVHQHLGQVSAGAAYAERCRWVRKANAEDLQTLLEMDRQAFGADRRRMIEEFNLIGSIAVIERAGDIQGYAICRPFGLGQVVGPVIACGAEDAKLLIEHFLRVNAGQILRIDTGGDSGLRDWLTAQGLSEVSSVTTMIRGQRPPITGRHRTFALASQSFG